LTLVRTNGPAWLGIQHNTEWRSLSASFQPGRVDNDWPDQL
jgi:hypothetical protein